jgi:hypothetical protein
MGGYAFQESGMVEHAPSRGSRGDFPDTFTAQNGLTQDISFFRNCHYGKWHPVVSRSLEAEILVAHFVNHQSICPFERDDQLKRKDYKDLKTEEEQRREFLFSKTLRISSSKLTCLVKV